MMKYGIISINPLKRFNHEVNWFLKFLNNSSFQLGLFLMKIKDKTSKSQTLKLKKSRHKILIHQQLFFGKLSNNWERPINYRLKNKSLSH